MRSTRITARVPGEIVPRIVVDIDHMSKEEGDRWMERCMETFPVGTELQLIAREAVVMTVCADNRVVK